MTRWTDHVKEFAKKKGIGYGCALSDPDVKKGYVPTGDKKRKPEKLEQAMPSTEPKPKSLVIKPRPAPAPNATTAQEKAKALHDKYLSLDRVRPKTAEIKREMEIVDAELFKITQPMLKAELEKNYFTGEGGKKIKFKIIPANTTQLFPDDGRTMAQGKDSKNPFPYLSFTYRNKEIDSLTEDGKFNQNGNNPNDLYKILSGAIKKKYIYSLENPFGERRYADRDLKSLLPNLLPKKA
jgi:hypothetical protein